MITLASHVFEYFFRFFLRACVICAFFGFVGVTWCDTPTFLAYPHVCLTCGLFVGFLGFFGVLQSYSCVGVDRHGVTAPILLLALRSAALLEFFFPNFAIFALVSDHLRNFCFYSWASLLVLPSLLCLPILLSLSPLVTSLRGLGCSPPSLVVPVIFALGEFYFCSSGAVSSSSSCSG